MYLVDTMLRSVVQFALVVIKERSLSLTASLVVIPLKSGIFAAGAETLRSYPDRITRVLATEKRGRDCCLSH